MEWRTGKVRLSLFVIVFMFAFMIRGCQVLVNKNSQDPFKFNENSKFYEAPHQLRKMFVKEKRTVIKTPSEGHLSGGFFGFVGGLSGDYKEGATVESTATHVGFAWNIKDNTYINTTLPLDKIRIKIVEKIETPTVSFLLDELTFNKDSREYLWRPPVYDAKGNLRTYIDPNIILTDHFNPHEAFSKYLKCAIFTIRSEHWLKNINLPDGGFE